MEVIGSSDTENFDRKVINSSTNNEPAILIDVPQDATALVGDTVLLKASYRGYPEPSVTWIKASRVIKNDEKTNITNGDGISCLHLKNITADDSGKYDICVKNIYGSDYSFVSVSVEGPPDPPTGKPCIISSPESITVTWSSSPYDGGKTVTGYIVEYCRDNKDLWTQIPENCHSLSYTFKNLEPSSYVFRVKAQNIYGYSKPGLESDIFDLSKLRKLSNFEPKMVVLEPGPEFKNRYEILEEIGKGRFGVVHKVNDKLNHKNLAAKFVRCRSAKDKQKVQEEIEIMTLLRHEKLLQLDAAFENSKEFILVMEFISGGELFERVVADDFTLTEKECILFMRQICEGVAYMHSQNIVHLDLKPENIMCNTRTSHEIKIIDFGLAQTLHPDKEVRVLFGTPEFIPPEIINYEPIGLKSDLWSIGVICYVLLSGLSPFMGENDAETFANITKTEYDFEDEAFNTVSQNARNFIAALLLKSKTDRLSAEQCLKHMWLDPNNHQETVILSTDKLKKFIIRRKWQKTGNAIRALGRMATLSASRRNSMNSTPNTPRQSLTGTSNPLLSKMSKLNEEYFSDDLNNSDSPGEEESNEFDENFMVKCVIDKDVDNEQTDHEVEPTFKSQTTISLQKNLVVNKKDIKTDEKVDLCEYTPKYKNINKLECKIETFENGNKSTPTCPKIKPMYSTYTSRSVASTIKKFNNIVEYQNNEHNFNEQQIKHPSRLSSTDLEEKDEKCSSTNENIVTKNGNENKESSSELKNTLENNTTSIKRSTSVNYKSDNVSNDKKPSTNLRPSKSQSEKFQKVAAFWKSPKT